ncbi:MAG: KGGVGR-motif variant AAA ATPase [Pseudomarimonas sp.]
MIYTFYSFKGGVGRSMAMAGVAYLFAQRGLRVLAVDFDLEAPGLERYFFDGERCKSVRAQPGLLDFIQDYRSALTSEAAFKKGDFKNWQRYCTPAIHGTGVKRGSVDLMTAGRREPETALRDYALTVRSFDWQAFFFNAKGDLFFDWLRRRLLEPDVGYDVVLVDSRTGVTEMGGVCAYQLADAAVLLCAANFQNLEGTREVARDFRSDSVRALRRGRPLELVAVPARIEPDHPGRAEFLARFKAELGVEGMPMVLADAGLDYERLAIPYDPAFAFAERLVGESPLAGDLKKPPVDLFECLADALTLLAPAGSRLHAQREEVLARLTGAAVAATAPLLADTTKSSAGFDAYIDFALEDHAVVAELTSVLEQAGFRVFHGRRSPAPGMSLVDARDQALEYSHTLLVAFGKPTNNESRARLIARARRLQTISILPLLLPGSDASVLASFDLSERQALDLRGWSVPEARERLMENLAAVLRQRQSASAAPMSATVEPMPYVGTRAYGEDDEAYFFGREDEIQQLVVLLNGHSVIHITGPAKVGKTSLVQAGVVPALRRLRNAKGDACLKCIERLDLSIDRPMVAMLEVASRADVLVLDAIDTFEGGGRESDRAARLNLLLRLLQTVGPDCRLILVARDVLGQGEREAARFAIDASLQGRSTTHLHVGPMARDALLRAIQGPAERAGHLLEPGLAERLIESVGASGSAIAHIQNLLATIWPERKRGWLTNRSLDASGHPDRLVAAHFLRVFGELEPDLLAASQALILRLVTLSGRRELMPSKQDWEQVATMPLLASVDAVRLRDRLIAEGFFDVYREEKAEGERERSSALQIALARPCAVAYFDETKTEINLKYLLWRDALAAQIRLWREGQDDALLRSAGLIEAETWLESHPEWMTEVERQFLQLSLTARAERSRKKQELIAREQKLKEQNDQDRLEAAEKLAAEMQLRAHIEQQGREAVQAYVNRLIRGRFWLVGMLLVAVAGVVFAMHFSGQAIAERKKAAEAEVLSARAEVVSARLALESLKEAEEAQVRVQQSAAVLIAAATDTLNAEDLSSRQSASARLADAQSEFAAASAPTAEPSDECPAGRRLYMHVANEVDRTSAQQLIGSLEKERFIVPGIELVNATPSITDVRYFRLSEQSGAAIAVRILRSAGVDPVRENYFEVQESSTALRSCHFEAWFAAGAFSKPPRQVTQPSSVTTLRYYRDSDRELVQTVAKKLGFNAEKGTSKLISLAPSVLVYSSDTSKADRIAAALAFFEAGFPLRAMGPARKVKDKQLIQVIASGPAESRCELLTEAEIRAGKECGGE